MSDPTNKPPEPDHVVGPEGAEPESLTEDEWLLFVASLRVQPDNPARLEDDPDVAAYIARNPEANRDAVRKMEAMLRAVRAANRSPASR